MQDESEQPPRTSTRAAADVTRRHDEARQRAAKDVAHAARRERRDDCDSTAWPVLRIALRGSAGRQQASVGSSPCEDQHIASSHGVNSSFSVSLRRR